MKSTNKNWAVVQCAVLNNKPNAWRKREHIYTATCVATLMCPEVQISYKLRMITWLSANVTPKHPEQLESEIPVDLYLLSLQEWMC